MYQICDHTIDRDPALLSQTFPVLVNRDIDFHQLLQTGRRTKNSISGRVSHFEAEQPLEICQLPSADVRSVSLEAIPMLPNETIEEMRERMLKNRRVPARRPEVVSFCQQWPQKAAIAFFLVILDDGHWCDSPQNGIFVPRIKIRRPSTIEHALVSKSCKNNARVHALVQAV